MFWRYINENRVSDSFGLAADEAIALRVGEKKSPPVLKLYTYRSHIALVGRFQRIENELNLGFCAGQQMAVNRRPTGGGAILMGEDQLGIAWMLRECNGCNTPRELMQHFASALCWGLAIMGIKARFRGKNDLEVNGRKIAGLGIHHNAKGGFLFHASLLLDMDVTLMLRALNVPLDKLEDKKIRSIEGRITTVRREGNSQSHLDEVREIMNNAFSYYFQVEFDKSTYSEEEKLAIGQLEKLKYQNEEWIYQKVDVPDMTGEAIQMTPAGLLDVKVTLAGRQLKAVFLGGDFFAGEAAIADIEGSLRWHSSETEQIRSTLEAIYLKREEELSFLPIDAVYDTITKASSSAIRQINSVGPSYGCFVNPQTDKTEFSNS